MNFKLSKEHQVILAMALFINNLNDNKNLVKQLVHHWDAGPAITSGAGDTLHCGNIFLARCCSGYKFTHNELDIDLVFNLYPSQTEEEMLQVIIDAFFQKFNYDLMIIRKTISDRSSSNKVKPLNFFNKLLGAKELETKIFVLDDVELKVVFNRSELSYFMSIITPKITDRFFYMLVRPSVICKSGHDGDTGKAFAELMF